MSDPIHRISAIEPPLTADRVQPSEVSPFDGASPAVRESCAKRGDFSTHCIKLGGRIVTVAHEFSVACGQGAGVHETLEKKRGAQLFERDTMPVIDAAQHTEIVRIVEEASLEGLGCIYGHQLVRQHPDPLLQREAQAQLVQSEQPERFVQPSFRFPPASANRNDWRNSRGIEDQTAQRSLRAPQIAVDRIH